MNRISQYCVFPIVWFFSKIFLTVEFRNPDGFKQIIGKPAVIIANHISFYDHFLLRLNKGSVDLDLYFMGVTRFNHWYMKLMWYTGIVPLVYFLFGVFLVVPGRGLARNIQPAKDLLAQGKQVFIFPEGSMNTEGIVRPFKKGAATIVSETGVPVLPVSYTLVRELGKRKKIIITLGEVMNFNQGQDPNIINTDLENRVRAMQADSNITVAEPAVETVKI